MKRELYFGSITDIIGVVMNDISIYDETRAATSS